LTYLVNRYFDTQVGGFISVDPEIESTGTPYAYASDAPTYLTDRLGLEGDGADGLEAGGEFGLLAPVDGGGPGEGSDGCAGNCTGEPPQPEPLPADPTADWNTSAAYYASSDYSEPGPSYADRLQVEKNGPQTTLNTSAQGINQALNDGSPWGPFATTDATIEAATKWTGIVRVGSTKRIREWASEHRANERGRSMARPNPQV